MSQSRQLSSFPNQIPLQPYSADYRANLSLYVMKVILGDSVTLIVPDPQIPSKSSKICHQNVQLDPLPPSRSLQV